MAFVFNGTTEGKRNFFEAHLLLSILIGTMEELKATSQFAERLPDTPQKSPIEGQ